MQLLEDLELKIAEEKLNDVELQSTIDAFSAIGKVFRARYVHVCMYVIRKCVFHYMCVYTYTFIYVLHIRVSV